MHVQPFSTFWYNPHVPLSMGGWITGGAAVGVEVEVAGGIVVTEMVGLGIGLGVGVNVSNWRLFLAVLLDAIRIVPCFCKTSSPAKNAITKALITRVVFT